MTIVDTSYTFIQFEADESYELVIRESFGTIVAATVFGAMHALEVIFLSFYLQIKDQLLTLVILRHFRNLFEIINCPVLLFLIIQLIRGGDCC